jgi:hypothetical protein
MPLESATSQTGGKAMRYQHILGDDQFVAEDPQILGDDRHRPTNRILFTFVQLEHRRYF